MKNSSTHGLSGSRESTVDRRRGAPARAGAPCERTGIVGRALLEVAVHVQHEVGGTAGAVEELHAAGAVGREAGDRVVRARLAGSEVEVAAARGGREVPREKGE